MSSQGAWHVYILRCRDGSLYTGITTDVRRRLAEHNSGARAARYTRARRPVTLCYSVRVADRAEASRLEHWIKRLPRRDKRRLIDGEPG